MKLKPLTHVILLFLLAPLGYSIARADFTTRPMEKTSRVQINDINLNANGGSAFQIQTAALAILKTALPTTYSQVGDVISYSYLVTNSGDVVLAGQVAVSDDKAIDESCPNVKSVGDHDKEFDPGESITCTASYTIIQADLDSGEVTNIASATAGGTISPTYSATVSATQETILTLVKTALPTTYDHVGQVIDYSYVLTNNGNVTLIEPFTVTDNISTDEACPATPTSLAPGASITCTASYTIAQADLDAGSVTNTAQGHGFFGTTPVDSNSDSVTVNAAGNPSLALLKTALPITYDHVGQVISYSFLVSNPGNVRLAGPVTISDNKTANELCPDLTTVGNLDGYLDPGESITCTASYTITQADLDFGLVTNVASATAGGTTSPTDTETVTAIQSPALALVKTALPTTYDHVGQVINYSFVLSNSGNVTLIAPFTITDDKTSNETCPSSPTSLAPGASITCTASYTITQADLNAGFVTNSAMGHGFFGTTPVESAVDSYTVSSAQGPALSLVKTALPTTYDHVGQVISYSFLVTNTGNVSLLGPVTISDDKSIDETCPDVSTVGNKDVYLDPTESITCTSSYTITQADLNLGFVTNVAVATVGGTTSPTDTETVTATQGPALTLDKTSPPPKTYNRVGQVISYSFLVANSGNVSLVGPVTVSDNKTTDEYCPPLTTVGNNDGFLDPDESITCSASYTITQADLNTGSVTNVAFASAAGINSPTDTETVTAAVGPALFIVKTAVPIVYDHPGQVISYSFVVQNTGNVTIDGPFIVFDDKATDEACPSTPTSLNPGEFITCTASYTILSSDMSAGSVTNAAYATGKKGPTTIKSNTATATITADKYTFIPIMNLTRLGVHVLAYSYQYVSHDTQFIVGEVANNTNNAITSVDVTVIFFGPSGNKVATSHAYLRPFDLPAWESGCFKIVTKVPSSWSYYQLNDPTYYVSGTSSGLKLIDNSGSYNPNNRDYNITGHTRNNGSKASRNVEVSGTVYNATGVPVGCEYDAINASLNPGQVSSFKINYLGYYRDYIDVAYYKLRVAGDLP